MPGDELTPEEGEIAVRDGRADNKEDTKRIETLSSEDDPSLSGDGLVEEDVNASANRPRRPGLVSRAWYKLQPRSTIYDPDDPPKFTLTMNFVFAFAATFTVATLYYNQAILYQIADTFDVSFEKASSIATLMQAGYASGLLFICPLGDILKRRPFILGVVACTSLLWLGLCLTKSFAVFSALSFLCGLTTVTPQLLLPLVGDLAPPERRGSSLAIVTSGLSLGLLIARLLGGILGNYTDWRNIYWFGLGTQWLIFILLFRFMPDYPSKNPGGLNYFKMLYNIFYLLATQPLLLQASLVAFCSSAVFTSYWTTLSFLLSSPPFNYSSLDIGLFGLIGIVVILLAPVYGRLVLDRLMPLVSAVIGLTFELAGLFVGTFTGSFSVAGPIVQAITIDIGAQFAQIANRSSIYGILPEARNRVNTAFMIMAFAGQLTGTAVGNRLYAEGGWTYSGALSIAFIGFAIFLCLLRGPRETGWIGWSGGWAFSRDKPKRDSENQIEEPLDETAGVVDAGEKRK